MSEVIKSFFLRAPGKRRREQKEKARSKKLIELARNVDLVWLEKFMNSLNSFRSVQVKSLGIYYGGRIKVSDV